MSEFTISKGSTILVTGVNGYVGSYTADQLLLAGYKVRGTVRDASRTQWVLELFDKKYGPGKFERVVVPRMDVEGAWEEAIKGVSGVAHIASIVSLSPDPNAVIPETVAGAVGILKAASREPSVKSIVFTSSAIATGSLPQPNVERTLTADSWNDEASILAWAPPPYEDQRRLAVYAASKTEAEKACWKFVQETKPGFKFNSVLPCAVIGPQLHASHVTPGSPLTWFKVLLGGDLEWVKSNAVSPFWSVDVRDVARLHVAALINPAVKSERLFAYGSAFNWSIILDIFRRIYPDKVFPEDIPNEAKDLSVIPSRERSVELLKTLGSNEFISLEESLKSTVRDFVA